MTPVLYGSRSTSSNDEKTINDVRYRSYDHSEMHAPYDSSLSDRERKDIQYLSIDG